MKGSSIAVFLADDNLIVREGVRALLNMESDLEVVGVASDYDELISGAESAAPQVIVTDIRMPPRFQREGIDAAKEVRKRHPGTGVVILSQYDEPEYAVSLLSEGAAGYAYLLKDRLAEGDQLVRAIREVASGGSVLDPKIVEALIRPVTRDGDLTPSDEDLLRMVAEGKPIKAIAVARHTTAADVAESIERLFVTLAQGLSAGNQKSLNQLKQLQQAIVDREEQGETLSRLLPGGIAEKLLAEGRRFGETEKLEVTVLMSDVRGYSSIAEKTDPSVLARQLQQHREAMNHAIIRDGGTVMQFVGDAVMGVFGAPVARPDHADRALTAALAMQEAQAEVNTRWAKEGLAPFPLGIGLSTGVVTAGILGSEERAEYSVVGDTVNLTQRIQQWARGGEMILTEATYKALQTKLDADALEPAYVKGRESPVVGYRIPRRARA